MSFKPTYTRAGIIPVIKHNNKLSVILFKEYYSHAYSEGGGRREKNEHDAKITACREMMEESKNVFNISPNTLTMGHLFTNIKTKGRKCTSVIFFIGLNDIHPLNLKVLFQHNHHTILQNGCVDTSWYETTDVDLFDIDDLMQLAFDENNEYVFFNENKIRCTTIQFIKKGLMDVNYPLNYTMVNEGTYLIKNMLYGTKSYYT